MKAEIKIIVLDTKDQFFVDKFLPFKEKFFYILSSTFEDYYGDEYQYNRMVQGQSIIYLAFVYNELVGVSYIKNNLRRAAMAVFPLENRKKGIGEALILKSLEIFPKQYSILNSKNKSMISLLQKSGFNKASDVQEISEITKEEFIHISNFILNESKELTFCRESKKRGKERESLILLHTFR